ncbi:MAG: exosortase system-associated protein, TIGR04073 family [candidate division NC10 bacterium]|nr:exosortase system-associated protein, TIGR04073 family [candidate division NC10 bacterium]
MGSVGRIVWLWALVLAVSAAGAWGEEQTSPNGAADGDGVAVDGAASVDGVSGPWEKAGRGLSNVTLGFLVEWPKTVVMETEAHGPAFGMTVGLIKGMGLGVGRTLLGVYELVTFPLPNGSDYEPVMDPGTPFSGARTVRLLDTPVR